MTNGTPIARAVELLKAGELVGIPTETVPGLAPTRRIPPPWPDLCRQGAARPITADRAIAGANHLERWAIDIPRSAYELAEDFWPGPLTLILKRARVPDAVTGGQDTVGLRVPWHPVALDLLRAFAAAGGSGGIAAPQPSVTLRPHQPDSPPTHVREELGDAVGMVLDGGACAVGIESTILDLSSGRPVLLRPATSRRRRSNRSSVAWRRQFTDGRGPAAPAR